MSSSIQNISGQQSRASKYEEAESVRTVSFGQLFRFGNKRDFIYMGIGTLCSIIIGGALPIFSLLWGTMTDAFKNPDEMVRMAYDIFIQYILFGVGSIFAGWGMQYFWLIAGENQANECRRLYVQSLMKQEIGWYQTQQSSQIVSKFISDSLAFQLAIGDKISMVIYQLSLFTSGLVISFMHGWRMALVVLASLPLLIFSWWLMAYFTSRKSEYQEQIFQDASGMAQETLQSITIVKMMNGQDHQQNRFNERIRQLKEKAFLFSLHQSLSYSFSLFCLLFAFTLSYWYGSQCVQGTPNCPQSGDNLYSGGTVLTIFFSLIIPAVNLNQLAPSLKHISEGRVAAARIFALIDRQPLIKSIENPVRPTNFKGVFNFNKVSFSYPKDKTKRVLSGLNMTIDCKNSGVMGQSGCGKSTILKLMMRLYDPDQGVITLDGVDIKLLDLHWLRSQIGYVDQEPMLFSASIKENLQVGKQDATEEDMILALRNAEILDFVAESSDHFNTYIGVGGNQLSGGQKQRIAIARALIKNPHLLLLDQATSALDRQNQRLIQQTLNKLSSDRISITVAHRPQTFRNCDKIYILEKGRLTKQQQASQLVFQRSNSLQSEVEVFSQLHLINNTSYKHSLQRAAKSFSINRLNSLDPFECTKQIILEEKDEKKQHKQEADDTYSRIFSYFEGTKLTIVIGIISSLVHGLVVPSMGIHVARILSFNLLYSYNTNFYRSQTRKDVYYMIITCFVGPIAIALQHFTFLVIGSNMINKIRQKIFSKVVKLPLSWFQKQDNNVEQMSVKLGADMITMNSIISRYFSHFCVALSSVVFGLLMAFYFEWRTALVSIVLIPLIGISGLFQSKMTSGYLTESQQLYEDSSKILTESLTNFKTVLAFSYQKRTIQKYMKKLQQIQVKQFHKKLISALIFGISYLILFLVYGLIFYLAALFIRNYNIQITNAFSAVFLVLFSGIMAGNNVKNIPELSRMKIIADNSFELIDLKDEDQHQIVKGSKRLNKDIKGNISFKKVSFKYENREQMALRNINFDIKEGDKVGLIGPSGCGKSTIFKLLLGFYQNQQGKIQIDGIPIQDYDVHCLRRNFCTVSQQPELFDETVEYNIVYNRKDIDKQRLFQTALKAKLVESKESLDTIETKHFLDRKVGPRGSHLSGGQKQRVAIARTILQDPTILLLDEATSALDKQNEMKVQQCLDIVMKGKTTLNITHQLQTLNNFSHILVFKDGEIVEEGTFKELLENNSHFNRKLTEADGQ